MIRCPASSGDQPWAVDRDALKVNSRSSPGSRPLRDQAFAEILIMLRRLVTHEVACLVAIWIALIVPASCSLATTTYPTTPVSERPGTLIREEPMLGAPEGAEAWRILYRST